MEIVADGSTSYASPIQRTGNSWLAETPIPDLADINADAQFEGQSITQHEFERLWLMSSEMITLHEPTLVKTIQNALAQNHLKAEEFVAQAINSYLDVQ